MQTVFIDGGTGEGGGQILRTSLALSCITGRSLHIENIRASRPRPGLAKQHLSCVRAACQICSGKAQGADQGSKVLDFQPGPVQSGDFYFDIGSAGSASLVIQTVLPALFLADKPSSVTVTGGTHNPLAPPFDFLCETFLPAIAAAGFHGNCKLIKHGFFPAGGGKITFDIKPWQKRPHEIINLCQPSPAPIRCEDGSMGAGFQIHARIYTAKLPAHIAQRQRKLLLQSGLNIQDIEHVEAADSDGPGNCVMIRLCPPRFACPSASCEANRGASQKRSSGGQQTTVFTAFGMRGKRSQEVISEVVGLARRFIDSGAGLDSFLADQLLLYMAIAKGGCYTTDRISTHLETNVEVIKKFLPADFVIERRQSLFRVSCQTVQGR